MAFQLVMILYWLALSTWFGGVLFIAIAAPIIFRTIRQSNPVLPDILSVNLEGQHGTLLAGSIVANLLQRLTQVELVCAGALFVALIAQTFISDITPDIADPNFRAALLRWILFLACIAIVAYDHFLIWPRILKARQDYLDHADEPDLANPAKERFDQEHKRSVSLLSAVLFLLLGLVLFSANITPKPRTISAPSIAASR